MLYASAFVSWEWKSESTAAWNHDVIVLDWKHSKEQGKPQAQLQHVFTFSKAIFSTEMHLLFDA